MWLLSFHMWSQTSTLTLMVRVFPLKSFADLHGLTFKNRVLISEDQTSRCAQLQLTAIEASTCFHFSVCLCFDSVFLVCCSSSSASLSSLSVSQPLCS